MEKEKYSFFESVLYYIVLGICRILSLLPFFIIFFISDVAYLLIYRIAGYRRKIVRTNLTKSFPEKSIEEIKQIERKFYHFICDYFFETLVAVYISKTRHRKHFIFKNPEVLDPYFEKKQSIILVAGHYGNWEMSNIMPLEIKHLPVAVYKPLTNKSLDRYYKKLRERFGLVAVPMTGIVKRLFTYERQGIPTITYLLSDQRPLRITIRHWMKFLNQDTPVYVGPEVLSIKFDLPVFYLDIQRVARGKYEAWYRLLEDKPKETSEFQITEHHNKFLEEIIKKEPAYWFWSHRRWGHEKF
jgi:Kdo2-lipid IVA lauroyltransferase/acyltransferase